MAQHDYVVSNASGSAVRSDLNNALAAIVTTNSGSSEPTTTYAYQFWADTSAGVLKIRNGANNAWITLRELDGTFLSEDGSAASPGIAFASDTNTGLYRIGADQIGFSTGGTLRATLDSSGKVGIGTSSPSYLLHLNTAATADIELGTQNSAGLARYGTRNSGNAFVGAFTAGKSLELWSAGSLNAVLDSSGRLGIGTSSPSALLHVNGDAIVGSLNGGPLAGTRNRIINGSMAIDQRNAGAAQTFTAAAALAYSVDRWYAYCTGANVTGQQVQGASAGLFRYRFTGAASVTAIGFGQRIEQQNSAALAGTTATLSVDLANSVLTTVTWTAFYANTADTFGTLASPTRTQIATGTFTVTSTVTRYNTNISIPSAATTGIEIVFTVGAQTSGTWTIGDVQLEPGSVATPFERRSFGVELALCQRYYEEVGSFMTGLAEGSTFISVQIPFARKRVSPTVAQISSRTATIRLLTGTGDFSSTNPSLTNATSGVSQLWTQVSNFSGLVANYPCTGRGTGADFISLSAEL